MVQSHPVDEPNPQYIITLTYAELLEIVTNLINEVDYDIAKQYDEEYEGREDDLHPTFDDVAGQIWVAHGGWDGIG